MFTPDAVIDAVSKQNAWVLSFVQPESLKNELLNLNNRTTEMAKTVNQQFTEFTKSMSKQLKQSFEKNSEFLFSK